MNYYPFHIGDYRSHTAHLTLLQDLAYRRLLELYYLHERALPPDPALCARRIGMSMHLEDVQVVLEDFFVLDEEGYRNKRCDEILAKFISQREKAQKAGIESGRVRRAWAERRENNRRAGVGPESNEAPTDGQRPLDALSTEAERPVNELPADVQHPLDEHSTVNERPLNARSATVEATNNQKPITKTFSPLTPLAGGDGGHAPPVEGAGANALPPPALASPPGEGGRRRSRRVVRPEDWAGVHIARPDEVPEALWRDFCALRKARSAAVTEAALDGIRREADKVGASLPDALAFMAARGHQGFIVDAWLRDRGGTVPPKVRRRLAAMEDFAEIDYGQGGAL